MLKFPLIWAQIDGPLPLAEMAAGQCLRGRSFDAAHYCNCPAVITGRLNGWLALQTLSIRVEFSSGIIREKAILTNWNTAY